jgi:ABC-type antimicrobial peptide transport system permease subunit
VAIVNQEFARRLYGSEENAMGKRFHEWGPSTPALEIIGIAKDGLYTSLYESPRPHFFLPEFQADYQSEMTLLVSATSSFDVGVVTESVRREIAQTDSRVPVFDLKIGDQNLAWAYWGPRLSAGLATAFGLLVLVLAATGLYSVMNYAVSRRTRELGIRMAIGAQISDMLKLVISEGMILVTIGTVIGLIGAFTVTGLLSSLLFGISPTNLPTFAVAALILLGVSLVACYIPARRATKVDPMIALRYE